MACPFLPNPIDLEARLIRNALRNERIVRPRPDLFSYPDEYLYERYRFTLQSLEYIHRLLQPRISSVTRQGHALSSEQVLCVALRFFANGSFLYNIGDAENIGKATVCRAVRSVTLALKEHLGDFVAFPGHKPVWNIKQEFYRIAGNTEVNANMSNFSWLMPSC